jgi:hypothetical protein
LYLRWSALRVSRRMWGHAGWGEVAAAARSGPDHDARFRLIKAPALGLFASMMMAAQWGQVALAGAATLIKRDRVVQVAADSGPPAARSSAGGGTGGDQVPETSARLIARLLMAVIAGAPGQRVNR